MSKLRSYDFLSGTAALTFFGFVGLAGLALILLIGISVLRSGIRNSLPRLTITQVSKQYPDFKNFLRGSNLGGYKRVANYHTNSNFFAYNLLITDLDKDGKQEVLVQTNQTDTKNFTLLDNNLKELKRIKLAENDFTRINNENKDVWLKSTWRNESGADYHGYMKELQIADKTYKIPVTAKLDVDLENDGKMEAVVMMYDTEWGDQNVDKFLFPKILIFDNSGNLILSYGKDDFYFNKVAVTDLDGDGKKEIILVGFGIEKLKK